MFLINHSNIDYKIKIYSYLFLEGNVTVIDPGSVPYEHYWYHFFSYAATLFRRCLFSAVLTIRQYQTSSRATVESFIQFWHWPLYSIRLIAILYPVHFLILISRTKITTSVLFIDNTVEQSTLIKLNKIEALDIEEKILFDKFHHISIATKWEIFNLCCRVKIQIYWIQMATIILSNRNTGPKNANSA